MALETSMQVCCNVNLFELAIIISSIAIGSPLSLDGACSLDLGSPCVNEDWRHIIVFASRFPPMPIEALRL